MCGFCDVENKSTEPLGLFSDEDYDRLIQGIATGVITTQKLDFNTYQKIARKLTDGVYEGFGKNIDNVSYGSADYLMLFDLRRNVYVFSGAKCYQEVRDVSDLLVNRDKNEIRSFNDFKDKASKILKRYNEDYLSAEYNSAIHQARSASQWMEFESESNLYPKLIYHTVGDGRVRPEHADMDGICRPINDKFWSKYMPPNGWNCRCTVLQDDGDTPNTSLKGFTPKNVPDIFQFNSGKDRIIYSPKHPYFQIASKDKDLAKRNFNFPLH